MARVSSDCQPGQTYVAYDMGLKTKPVIYTLLSRIETEADWKEDIAYHNKPSGWKGGPCEHGWFWLMLDLQTGQLMIWIDNILFNKNWQLM